VTVAEPLGAGGAVTAMLKAGRALDVCPSLTLITMLPYVPVCALVGVPDSSPLAMLKFAQEGMFCTENESVMPVGPLAVGWNE